MKSGIQHGKTTLTVRLAFDCYDDTHYGSSQEQHAAERMALAGRLNPICTAGGSTNAPPS